MVVYAQPCGPDTLTPGCIPYCNYYYQLYHWIHPSTLTPIGSPVALSSCSMFDRISIDINGVGNKAVVVWGHNNSALFSKAFDFSGGSLSIGPTVTISTRGNLADVAFRLDPKTNTEYLHYAYFSYLYRSSCEISYQKDSSIGLSKSTFVHSYTLFDSIMVGNGALPFGLNLEPTGLAGKVDDVNLIIDAPDTSSAPNWSYTWSEKGGNKSYVRTYKDGVSSPSDSSWIANDGITPLGTVPKFTSGKNPTLAYSPIGNNYFVGFAGGPKGYIGTQISDLGSLISSSDYLNLPNNSYACGSTPLVAFSKNSTGNYLYNVFGQEDSLGNYSLVHKAHPWASSSTWRQSKDNTLSQSKAQSQAQLMPVPFKDDIVFAVPQGNELLEYKLNICDVQGRILYQCNGNASTINQFLHSNVRNLQQGIYLFHTISPQGEVKTFKTLKN